MVMSKEQTQSNTIPRAPVVVVMGHIDHGKSTLLDYIRKSNVVEKETGGITQHLSAYEVTHKDEHGKDRGITFLDTPGHEAFSGMRERGAATADIAILVVSAEDSVKAQTLEAFKTIEESKVPYIVAINKIDKPGANIEKTKMDLSEKGIYLEGFGGDVPFVEISAKQGTNIDALLDLILLVADLNGFTGNPTLPAEGTIIEAHRDQKRGITATLLIKNGTLKKGMYVVAGGTMVPTRILENFLGKPIDEATFSSPIRIVGFDQMPKAGATFTSYASKKEAEVALATGVRGIVKEKAFEAADGVKVIPIIIKTDVMGTADAVWKEIQKLELDDVKFKVLEKTVGAISEGDIRLASSDKESIIIGFNVKIDSRAQDLNERAGVEVKTFDIIYHIADYLKVIVETRKPRFQVLETTGKLRVLKVFNKTKERQVVGGKVTEGKITDSEKVRILRRDFEIGQATIVGLERSKIKAREVEEGAECGILIESKVEIAGGDVLEGFTMVTK